MLTRKDICILVEDDDVCVGQEDPSQVFALASVWFLILAFGGSVCLVPMLYTINLAYQDILNSEAVYSSQPALLEVLGMLNTVLFILLGSVIGCPIASASGNVAIHPSFSFSFPLLYSIC